MSKKRIVSVMPIKLNNERLPGKNTMMLGDKPLIRYELDTLLSIKEISDIYVFCSQDSIKKYLPQSVRYLKRPEYLDLPTSNFNQIFDEFLKIIDADIYVYAHATAPFVKKESIEKCLSAVISRQYDSAFCATEIRDFLWKDGKPLNFDASNVPRSQDLDPIYEETSGVYVFTKKSYERTHRRIGEKPYICITSKKEAVDINTVEDFELAKLYLNADE